MLSVNNIITKKDKIFSQKVLTDNILYYIMLSQDNKGDDKMLPTTDIKKTSEQLIDLLKQLPKDKQEFVNGYVQGVADSQKNIDKSA